MKLSKKKAEKIHAEIIEVIMKAFEDMRKQYESEDNIKIRKMFKGGLS